MNEVLNLLTLKEFEERFVLNMAQSSEITGIDFDADGGRLVVCNRNAVVQLYGLDPLMNLSPLFSVTLDNIVPKSVAFGSKANDCKVIVFGLYDGAV